MIISNFDTTTRILCSKFSGKITIDELVEYFLQLGVSNDLPIDLLYFGDHTEAEYIFKPQEIKRLMRILTICVKRYNSIRAAILHAKPKETAYSIIALQDFNLSHSKVLVFSTQEAALQWLTIKSKSKV